MSFPSRLLFTATAPCPRVETIEIDGQLDDWAEVPALPALPQLDGDRYFATVKVAYGDPGLYVAVEVPKEIPIAVNRQRPHNGDSLQVWIDTRGVSGGHRATRFCTHFILLPSGGGARRNQPMGFQRPIRRALDDAELCDPEDIALAVAVEKHSYSMEALLPAHAVSGFEPEPGTVIRFHYVVTDLMHRRQTYALGDQFPHGSDPSIWGKLRLGE